MMTSTLNRRMPPLMLQARTAADLMTPNPQSLRLGATVAEAAAFLSTRGFSAAPVIDESGRPVGVVSRTDLLHRHGQKAVSLLAHLDREPATPDQARAIFGLAPRGG